MAIYNEILAPRYSRHLQKLFGMKGGNAAKQLSGEVMASYNLFGGVENRFLELWSRFSLNIGQTAVAGQTNGLQLRNPAGSNIVAVMEYWDFLSNGAGDTFFLAQARGNPADLTTVGNGFSIDNRDIRPSTCIASSQAASPAAIGTNILTFGLQNGVLYNVFGHSDACLLLLPGDAYRITNTVAQSTTRWNVVWRERFLEESERQ